MALRSSRNRSPNRGPEKKLPPMAAAFTLLELLAVITLIALLAGLLIPAVLSARLKAYETECSSNLGQIGVGLYQAAASQEGRFPPAQGYATDEDTSYFGQQGPLLDALAEDFPQDSRAWFCQRYVREQARLAGITPEDFIEQEKATNHIGYFYWAWDGVVNVRHWQITASASSNVWIGQGWNANLPGIVLASDRFHDHQFWDHPDWQYHGGRRLQVALDEPGSLVLISGGAVRKTAPR